MANTPQRPPQRSFQDPLSDSRRPGPLPDARTPPHQPGVQPQVPPEGHDYAQPGPGEPGGPSSPADPSMQTIADEQRQRSEEIESKGVDPWKAEHDDRNRPDADRRQRQVPGVSRHSEI